MAHNIISGVEVPGPHPGMPLSRFAFYGTAGENALNLLKRKGAGGLAADVPIHDHSIAAQAGPAAPQFRQIFLLAGM